MSTPPPAPTPRRRRRAPHLVLALALVALLAAAACGADTVPTTEVASIDDGDSSADGATGDDAEEMSEAEREDLLLEFAQCMRDHGVDMPDPEMSGGGGGVAIRAEKAEGATGEPPTEAEQQEVEAAHEACEPILEEAMTDAPELSPEEEAEMRDQMLAFTECMRENGIDMPDPEFGEGPGGARVRVGSAEGPAAGGIDPESPEFQAAQEECSEAMDGRGPMVAGSSDGAETAEAGE